MLDLKFLRQNRERVEAGIALKGMTVDLARFYAIAERRLQLLHESEELKARRNAAGEEIASGRKRGAPADDEIRTMREVGELIQGLAAELKQLEEARQALASWIPDLP